MNPIPIIIRHADWEAFAEEKTETAYENIDNYLDKLSGHLEALRVPKDIVAGAYYDGKNIYFDEKRWNGRRVAYLAEHELGHYWKTPGENHPTTIRKGIRHAIVCNFDTRSYADVFRFRRNPATKVAADMWLQHWKSEFQAGRLQVQPKP